MIYAPLFWLQSVCHFLNRVIQEEGDRLFVLLVYGAVFVIGWIWGGGLWRRKRQRWQARPRVISVMWRDTPSFPSRMKEREQEPPDDDETSFSA